MIEKEFTYSSKEEYERALENILDPANRDNICRSCMSEKDLEEYDQLLEEYIEFCDSLGAVDV